MSGYFYSIDELCYNTSPPRYYVDPVSQIVKKCPFDCFTCNPDGTCLSCNSTVDFRILDSASNRCVAMEGYFDNLVQICVRCMPFCQRCQSLAKCQYCM